MTEVFSGLYTKVLSELNTDAVDVSRAETHAYRIKVAGKTICTFNDTEGFCVSAFLDVKHEKEGDTHVLSPGNGSEYEPFKVVIRPK